MDIFGSVIFIKPKLCPSFFIWSVFQVSRKALNWSFSLYAIFSFFGGKKCFVGRIPNNHFFLWNNLLADKSAFVTLKCNPKQAQKET